jgi:hypothetical protein
MTLKPYHVYTDDSGGRSELVRSELVWARSPASAIAVAWAGPTFRGSDDLQATVKPVIDGTQPDAADAHRERRDHVLRDYGWGYVDDDRCGCCGLAEMGGAFPVCPECDQCSDCGHDEECSCSSCEELP